jgi:protein TonB
VELARSSGDKLLDAEALRLARDARFTPARRQEGPVAAWVTLPIRFQLVESEARPAPAPASAGEIAP